MGQVHPLSSKKTKSMLPLQHSKMSSQFNKSRPRQFFPEHILTSLKAAEYAYGSLNNRHHFQLFSMSLFSAFVGSATLGMLWFASPLAGYLCDRFGCRIATFFGGVLCMTGLISTSFLQSLTPMYFTYSLVLGLGACFIVNSSFLVIGQYFQEKLSMATGIVSLGASLGVLYTGPLLQVLLDSFGWRGTLRIMTTSFALVCFLSLAFNPNVEGITPVETIANHGNGNEVEERNGICLYCSVWTFPTFTVVVISLMFGSFGMYIPYINLVSPLFVCSTTLRD